MHLYSDLIISVLQKSRPDSIIVTWKYGIENFQLNQKRKIEKLSSVHMYWIAFTYGKLPALYG